MGSTLTGIFGGGGTTTQKQQLDPTTQALNQLRLHQTQGLFNALPLSSFANDNGAYSPTPEVNQLWGYAGSDLNSQAVQPKGNMSYDQYQQGGLGNIDQYTQRAIDNLKENAVGLRGAAGADTQGALGTLGQGYQQAIGNANQNYQQALAQNTGLYNQALGQGTSALQDYIKQVATPSIMQNSVLQGLDSGAAVPAAIAKASAGVAAPYLQAMQQQYLGQQGQLGQQNAALQGQLSGQNLGGIEQLSGQGLGQLGQIGQQLMSGQAGMYGQAGQQAANLWGSLPGAYSQFNLLPGQLQQQLAGIQQQRAQTASTLFPIADYSRQLQEQNLLRQQGLAQTALTGLPYTPQVGSTQKQNQQPLFNFFGQG